MRKWSGWLLAGLMVAMPALPAFAQTQKASKTYVLKAARMFDGKSNTLSTPGLVVVTDGKIAGVGAKATIPAGAETIDLGDAMLLPGFIDAHTHLTSMYSDDWKQNTLDRLQKTVAEQALDASANARVTLMAGFTTVRDVGSSDYLDVGLRNAISDGVVPGPRMLVTALAKGVKIGFGTDAAVYQHGRNAEEFHLMVDLGMKPFDALRSAALADAELLGLQDKIGTLDAGKLADIVAVPGNPGENIRQTEKVFFVMKEGTIYRNDRSAPQR